jgi:Xaa-Pro aminopeptidase
MADAGFIRALEVIKQGLPDYELVAEIDYAMREMGATDNFQMLAVGKQISGMLLPFGKKVEKGDLLLFEITPAHGPETYSAQLCRTAIFGEPPDELVQAKYRLLIEALEESLSVIKPGVRISEVARIQNEIIGKAGYGEYCRPPYMRARGHGFGLGRIDAEEDSTLEFAAGMSLVVHPNQFLPETGYLALGEHILVTDTGMERLTRTESKIYECPDAG